MNTQPGQKKRMNNFVWTSDIHLDRMDETEYRELKDWLLENDSDAIVLAGDIAEADSVVDYLADIDSEVNCPLYFVLGNHDFYKASYGEVSDSIGSVVRERENLCWLSETDVVPLNGRTAMIGHEGWGDARCGNFNIKGEVPRDFMLIRDLVKLRREEYVAKLNKLGDMSAQHIGRVLPQAVDRYEEIYLVTHVPPFEEACIGKDLRICDDQKLTFYVCKAMGDVIREVMDENPGFQLTVLCGHTHHECDRQITDNIRVVVKESGYGVFYEPLYIRLE